MIRIHLVDGSHIDTDTYDLIQATDLYFAKRPLVGVRDNADGNRLDIEAGDISHLSETAQAETA